MSSTELDTWIGERHSIFGLFFFLYLVRNSIVILNLHSNQYTMSASVHIRTLQLR